MFRLASVESGSRRALRLAHVRPGPLRVPTPRDHRSPYPRTEGDCDVVKSLARLLGGHDACGLRHYRSNSQLFDELERRTDEVETVIRGVSGFVSYYLVRTEDGGGFSVSVFEDKTGTDESIRVAADWVRQNVPQAVGSPPEVMEGRVILQMSK